MGDNRSKPLRPPFGQSHSLPPLPLEVIRGLEAKAKERGQTVDELVALILVLIVEGNLFKAVIDD